VHASESGNNINSIVGSQNLGKLNYKNDRHDVRQKEDLGSNAVVTNLSPKKSTGENIEKNEPNPRRSEKKNFFQRFFCCS
jgi:hypothetical protein